MKKGISKKTLKYINKNHRMTRILFLALGCFLYAFCYNFFVARNQMVTGGIGGIAVVVNYLFGVQNTTFINIVTLILLLIGILIVGKKNTMYTVVGYLMYVIMLNLTEPLLDFIPYEKDGFLLEIIAFAAVNGIGNGLIHRAGFNTGGTDTIILILQKYLKIPGSKISNVINGIIITLGAIVFGIEKSIYAITYLIILNFISNRVTLGESDSKLCFIKSKKSQKIEQFLQKKLKVSYTIIDSNNGISILNKGIIMCVVPTTMFYSLKRNIKDIDKKCLLISNDCYSVEGGTTNHLFDV